MSILFPVILGIILLAAGYFFYGIILSRLLRLRHDFKTPAHEFRDGIDFEPANKFYLLGQHLSAIAAAGPIDNGFGVAYFSGYAYNRGSKNIF